MSIFKSISPNDIYVTPFEVHKRYSVTSYNASSSYGILPYQGEYNWGPYSISDLTNSTVANLETTTGGNYKYIIHESINNMFYERFRFDNLSTLSKSPLGQYRELHEKVNFLSIPQNIFAEKIKENTVDIIDYSIPGASLISNSKFDSGSTGWYSGLSSSAAGSSSIIFSPISFYGYTSSISTPKITFISNKIYTASLTGSSYNDEFYITSSISGTLESSKCYKLIVDIDNASTFHPATGSNISYVYADPIISTMSIDISGSGGNVSTIYVPVDKKRYEFDIIPSNDISNAKISLFATQHLDFGDLSGSNQINLFYENQNRITFNEISLSQRGSISHTYEDDGYGNLLDNNSQNDLFDDIQTNVVGEWTFNDGYIDSMDERRKNTTSDSTIYLNHGLCTNVDFVDGIYGKSAKFGQIRNISEIISITSSFETSSNIYQREFTTILNLPDDGHPHSATETSTVGYPLISKVYSLYSYTASASPYLEKSNLNFEPNKLYRLTFWSKSSYTSSAAPVVSISTFSSSIQLHGETIEVDSYWRKNESFFSVTGSYTSASIRLDLSNNLNLISDYPTGKNYNEQLYITNIQLDVVEQISNVRIWNNDIFNFAAWDKFALECIVKLPQVQNDIIDGNYNIIVTKNGRYKKVIESSNAAIIESIHNSTSGSSWYLLNNEQNVDFDGKYPYQLAVTNQLSSIPGRIRASRRNGLNEIVLESSSSVNDNNYHHIMLQKTGSQVELYVDGIIEASASDFSTETFSDCSDRMNVPDVQNLSDLFIGSRGDDKYNFTGEIDCVRIHNNAYTQTDILNLYNLQLVSKNFNYRIGNVFYEQGFITLTSPYDIYADTFIYTGSNANDIGYSLGFNNNLTFYEVEVHCPVDAGEYNHTMNYTARARADIYSDRLACFTTHSQFSPYVTTVGLYNENAELVAVGKVSKPIKVLDNVDTTFVVKFDV